MNMDFIENGGVTSPLGFQAAGVCAGLKRSHAPDMAMIWSEAPCSFSGTFTSNLFPAAPVQLCRERAASASGLGLTKESFLSLAKSFLPSWIMPPGFSMRWQSKIWV